MIDTHCHLNFKTYDNDRDEVVARMHEHGIDRVIVPAIDVDTCHEVIALTKQYSEVYGAAGIHPNDTANWQPELIDSIREFAAKPKIVSIGEIGLDYYWDKSPPATQKVAFKAQLALAAELELPVIIHNREAHDDVIAMLEEWASDLPPSLHQRAGVLHSFSAPQEVADRALQAGFYIGFTGPVTFKKADDLRAVAVTIPLDRILVETDGPFLSPHPRRGKRNEPANVRYVVEKLAEIHGISTDEMAHITTENAERLFLLNQT